jgi:heme-degrading monooxygenase HmoA
MHARLSTYEGPAGELTQGFDAQTDALKELDGFKAAYFGVSDSGKAFSLTLWESEDALNASAERAKQLRSDATQPSGAEIQSVEHFEITATVGDA